MSVSKTVVAAPYDNSSVTNYKSWTAAFASLMSGVRWARTPSATGSLALSSVANASADSTGSTGATTVYTFTATRANFATFVGLIFTVSGFTNAANNGAWTCVASTNSTITLANASGVSETHSATCSGDSGQVTWANITKAPVQCGMAVTALPNFRGAWAKQTAYSVGDIVNDGGASFQCVTAFPASLAITVTATAGGNTTYTFSSQSDATTNNWVGLCVTVSGYTSPNTGNNGDFVITASTTTTFTVANASGTSSTTGTPIFIFNSGPGTKHTGTAVYCDFPTSPAANKWVQYNYEVYVNSNSTYFGTLPYYIKFVYGSNSSRSGPEVYVQQGTTFASSTGMFGGNQFNGTAASGLHVQMMGSSGANNQGTSLFDMCICGNAQNFAMTVWRSLGSSSSTFVIDCARDQNGNELDSYYFVGLCTKTANLSQCVFKPETGTISPFGSSGAAETTWPTIHTQISSAVYNGLTPATPVFPMPGWVGNPILGAVALRTGDCTDGELINVVLYGVSHTFLVCKNSTSALAGVSNVAIRWENA